MAILSFGTSLGMRDWSLAQEEQAAAWAIRWGAAWTLLVLWVTPPNGKVLAADLAGFLGARAAQGTIRTLVPTGAFWKRVRAISLGIRMQPWEAGLPGFGMGPTCMPIPYEVRRIQ